MHTWLRRILLLLVAFVFLVQVAIGAVYWYISHPEPENNPLDPRLIAMGSAEGRTLESSSLKADLDPLRAALQSQEKRSWCGVASGATALSALRGEQISQSELLKRAPTARSWVRVTFAGMPLQALESILAANGARANATHAGEAAVDWFRAALDRNMADPGDALVINYDREVLGQIGGGHISPVGAWNRDADRVLILDVATLCYPPVWVDADLLFEAMSGIDGESGVSRGWVELSP